MDNQLFSQNVSNSKDFLGKIAENIQLQVAENTNTEPEFVTLLETCEELVEDYIRTSRRSY